jgi:hypothetical protein
MRHLLFNTEDEDTKEKLLKELRDLPDGEYHITIKKNKPIRSLKANAYYWVILNIIGAETGHDREQLHEICKKKFNSDVILYPKGGLEIVGRSTSDLDTAEFTAYVNRVKMWAQDDWGIEIPEAKDVDYKRWMEIENAYDKSQSGF